MAKSPIAFEEPYSLSVTPSENGDFIVIAKTKGTRQDLLLVGICNLRKSPKYLLEKFFPVVAECPPLNPIEVRLTLSVEQKKAMTRHLLELLRISPMSIRSPAENLVWRYNSLLAWGESAAAKVLAEDEGVPVRTVHSRLRLAREKGILDSPGSGSRLVKG